MKISTFFCVLLGVTLLLEGCMLIPKFETYEDHRGDWYEKDVKEAEENL